MDEYERLARAVIDGMPLSEATKILDAMPPSMGKVKFWETLKQKHTTVPVTASTKARLAMYKYPGMTWDDVLEALVKCAIEGGEEYQKFFVPQKK